MIAGNRRESVYFLKLLAGNPPSRWLSALGAIFSVAQLRIAEEFTVVIVI